MVRSLALAVVAAAAIILSAPFAQELFTVLSTTWPQQFRSIAIGATAVPASIAVLAAVARIHNRHLLRYSLLALAGIVGAGYIFADALSVTESFHFVEYGVLGFLFYRVWRSVTDPSLLALPILATTIAGIVDEWFQWLIPIRAGEARDVVLNAVAGVCGVLVALAVDPPDGLRLRLQRGSGPRVTWCSAAAGLVFAAFFLTVHVGYEVSDPEVGSFPSRYSADALQRASQDRAERWRTRPPVLQRRLSREDQYLTEGLWHVARRNGAWAAGDVVTAWRENRILEKFYAPVLDSPTYAGREGHRWPPAQRVDAGERRGSKAGPYASHDYAYPLYVWPGRCCSF
jgi:VanZ like protein